MRLAEGHEQGGSDGPGPADAGTAVDDEPVPGIHALGALKGINKDPQEMHEKLPDLIERWRDTFGV